MQLSYGTCFITNTGLFSLLDEEILKRIAKKSLVHHFTRKNDPEREFTINGKVYIIHQGCAFLSYIDPNGKKIVLDILTQGSIFGDLDFTNNQSPSNDSLFLEPFPEAGVCEMKKGEFKDILKECPDFTISLLSTYSKRLLSLEQRIGTLAFSDVEARLIAQIVDLSQKYGQENDKTLRLNIKITHEKLAEMIGAARETVSESISDLKKKNILSIDKNRKIILRKDKIDPYLLERAIS